MRITEGVLIDGVQIKFGDFNVFIGGNGVGKTTFLLELFFRSANIPRNKYYWINEAKYYTDNVSEDIKLLKSSLSRQYEGANLFFHSQAVKNIEGNTDLSVNLRFSFSEIEQIESKNDISVFSDVKYRRPFISFSSCESRLNLPNEVEVTGLDQPPQDSINVLYRNKKLLKEIDKTTMEIFNLHFILLDHTKRRLHLGLSDEISPPFDPNTENAQDEYEKIQKWKDAKFTMISESGHGIRSMIKLLTSLLEPVNKVIVIDEPEMHLYPSQKRWLGKQLVKLAKKQKKQVFLVTHDPMVLQGILDANTKTTIFRIERDNKAKGLIKTCEMDRITDKVAQRNQEQYLQGLFYQRCIIVEGASDRFFYQNMMDDYQEVQDKDLGYVACGGKGSTKHMANIVTKVGLKVSFIYDYDVILFKTDLIKEIYTILGGNGNPLSKLEDLFNQNEQVKNAKDDKERNNVIKLLTNYKEKEGISGDWVNKNEAVFDELFNELAKFGIFIVPNGTLESWAPDVEPKVRFSELAPDIIRSNSQLNFKFKEFAKKVLGYLNIILQ